MQLNVSAQADFLSVGMDAVNPWNKQAVVVFLAADTKRGGYINPEILSYSINENRIVFTPLRTASAPKNASSEQLEYTPVTPADKLETINKAFGLAVSDYANIFGIERATYYNWTNKKLPPKDPNNLQLIDDLFQIARQVEIFNRHPYRRLAKTHSIDDRTLLSLLNERKLNGPKIVQYCQKLTQMIEARVQAAQGAEHGEIQPPDTVTGFEHDS